MDTRTKQSLSTHKTMMEYPWNKMSCMLSLITSDLENFETVKGLYFGERENENDQEAYDSPLDESSSESEDDGETHSCIDFADTDLLEKAKVEKFITDTCNCKFGDGRQECSTTISLDDIHFSRDNCPELSSTEPHLVVLGAIQSSLNCGEVSESGRSEKKRERTRMTFFFHGKRICKEAFLFLHCISRTKFRSLVKHYKKNGLTLRSHGNKKRLPSSTFSAETVENVVKFILNIAEDQALLLPGRVPSFKRVDVKLLPSVLTKHSLWKTYSEICMGNGQISVGDYKFCDLWNQLCAFVAIMCPTTDFCWTCQKNDNFTQKSVNMPENQKPEAIRAQEQQLRLAAGEREFYKNCCRQSKENICQHLQQIDFNFGRTPCSYNGTVHYSYDYAQQLHYPSDPNQPGSIYFETPRKCATFGVCCESIPRHVNFLTDQNVLNGKGANSTISYVHYFFSRHGLGETTAEIHADNCGAQIRTPRSYGITHGEL